MTETCSDVDAWRCHLSFARILVPCEITHGVLGVRIQNSGSKKTSGILLPNLRDRLQFVRCCMDSPGLSLDSQVNIQLHVMHGEPQDKVLGAVDIPGQFTPPASPLPTATTNPSLLTRREHEQDPAVVDKTFPVLNESFRPRTLSWSPKPSVEYHHGCSGRGGVDNHEAGVHSVFTAANRPTKTQKLVRLKDKTKEAIKHGVLHHYGDDSTPEQPDDGDGGGGDERHGGFISRAASLVSHPRSAIKEKLTGAVASQISDLNTPYVPQGTEAAFVAAHAMKESAIECDDIAGVDDADRSIEELEIKMRNMRMGMIMGRHIRKVRALPQRRRDYPLKEEFLIRDERGEVMKDELGNEQVDYLNWLGQVCLIVNCKYKRRYLILRVRVCEWHFTPSRRILIHLC